MIEGNGSIGSKITREKRSIKEKIRTNLLRLFKKDHAPSRLAIGFALGSCVNFFPTFGLGLPFAIILAFLTRSSIIASIIGENLFKIAYPVTMYMSILIGSLMFPIDSPPRDISSILEICRSWHNFAPYARLFICGAIANTIVFGSILFAVTYYLLTQHRERIIEWLSKREEENI